MKLDWRRKRFFLTNKSYGDFILEKQKTCKHEKGLEEIESYTYTIGYKRPFFKKEFNIFVKCPICDKEFIELKNK